MEEFYQARAWQCVLFSRSTETYNQRRLLLRTLATVPEKGITAKNVKLVREHKLKVYQHIFPICVNTTRKYADPKGSKNPRSFASLVNRVLKKLCDIASAPQPILMASVNCKRAFKKRGDVPFFLRPKSPLSKIFC